MHERGVRLRREYWSNIGHVITLEVIVRKRTQINIYLKLHIWSWYLWLPHTLLSYPISSNHPVSSILWSLALINIIYIYRWTIYVMILPLFCLLCGIFDLKSIPISTWIRVKSEVNKCLMITYFSRNSCIQLFVLTSSKCCSWYFWWGQGPCSHIPCPREVKLQRILLWSLDNRNYKRYHTLYPC